MTDMIENKTFDEIRVGDAANLTRALRGEDVEALAAVTDNVNLMLLERTSQGRSLFYFTAGIGENAPEIRERVCRQSAWLGIALDPETNRQGGPRITTDGSAVSAWVLPTDEERMIAIHTLNVLAPR